MKLSAKWPALRKPQMDQLLERTLDGVGQIAMHEAGALDQHLDALRERWAVARKARGPVELLRDQIDLLPASRARFAADHQARLKLWKELRQQFRGR